MKSELRIKPHSILRGYEVVEIWYNGEFIGQVTGDDGPGVRILTKHAIKAIPQLGGAVNIMGVTIQPQGEAG